MLKSKIIVLTCFLLVGCADTPAPIDVAFKPFVNRFEVLLGKTIKFSVLFADMDQQYAGMCWLYSTGDRKIEINPYSWDKLNELGKEEVIFHELGHCELGRGHTYDSTKDGYPASIMYPVAFGEAPFYEENHYYYINELLTNKVYEYGIVSSNKFEGDYRKRD